MLKKLTKFASILPFVLYALYSYAHTDPNLVFTQNKIYWQFQEFMWGIGYHARTISFWLYLCLALAMLHSFFKLVTEKRELIKRNMFLVISTLLLLAYPALSHDLFNYMFNAKMVVKYNLNPHRHVALEISSDDWLRFMHNTHTPAPYGYGWTALSLLPYSIGSHAFNPTYLAFRVWMLAGVFVLFGIVRWIQSSKPIPSRWYTWFLFLHPLFLIETIGNAHNDIWMMVFTLASYGVLLRIQPGWRTHRKWGWILVAGVLYGASVSIKLATVVLAPVVLILTLYVFSKNKLIYTLQSYWADASALLLLAPLVTTRSQQFHPWYIIWSLSFIPFIKTAKIRFVILALSISSMFRYLPFISQGEYSEALLRQEQIITWFGAAIVFIILWISRWHKTRMLQ